MKAKEGIGNMYCSKCGRKLKEEDLFCPRCGAKNKVIWKQKNAEAPVEEKIKNTIPIPDKEPSDHMAEQPPAEEKEKPAENDSKSTRKFVMAAGLIVAVIIGSTMFKNYQIRSGGYAESPTTIIVNKMRDPEIYGYGAGTYKVGEEIPAGEYVVFATTNKQGKVEVSKDSTNENILIEELFQYNTIVTVLDGEYLSLKQCKAKPMDSVNSINTTGKGMFKIGKHLPAGEYKLIADSDNAYFCIYNNSRHQDIIDNDLFEGNSYVTVKDGQYLILKRCHIENQP